MIGFDANLFALFTELPLADRFRAAAEAGFRAVELPVPYEFRPAQLHMLAADAGLWIVQINAPAGDHQTERGLACQPLNWQRFRQSVDEAIAMAGTIGCRIIHFAAGMVPEAADPEDVRATYLDNLSFAARALAKEGMVAAVEPLNALDFPSFYLTRFAQAVEIVEQVNEPNLKIIADSYHMARMGESIAEAIDRWPHLVGHVQIADSPGKGEPGTGEVDFAALFKALRRIDYQGWIGLEYRPSVDSLASFGWMDGARALLE